MWAATHVTTLLASVAILLLSSSLLSASASSIRAKAGFVTVAGSRIYTRVNGVGLHASKPTVVFMSGLATPSTYWAALEDLLATTGKYRTLVYDRPGVDRSDELEAKCRPLVLLPQSIPGSPTINSMNAMQVALPLKPVPQPAGTAANDDKRRQTQQEAPKEPPLNGTAIDDAIPIPMPRTAVEIAGELAAVLKALKLTRSPVIVVAHSIAEMAARAFVRGAMSGLPKWVGLGHNVSFLPPAQECSGASYGGDGSNAARVRVAADPRAIGIKVKGLVLVDGTMAEQLVLLEQLLMAPPPSPTDEEDGLPQTASGSSHSSSSSSNSTANDAGARSTHDDAGGDSSNSTAAPSQPPSASPSPAGASYGQVLTLMYLQALEQGLPTSSLLEFVGQFESARQVVGLRLGQPPLYVIASTKDLPAEVAAGKEALVRAWLKLTRTGACQVSLSDVGHMVPLERPSEIFSGLRFIAGGGRVADRCSAASGHYKPPQRNW